jgi:hypothetical protein
VEDDKSGEGRVSLAAGPISRVHVCLYTSAEAFVVKTISMTYRMNKAKFESGPMRKQNVGKGGWGCLDDPTKPAVGLSQA